MKILFKAYFHFNDERIEQFFLWIEETTTNERRAVEEVENGKK